MPRRRMTEEQKKSAAERLRIAREKRLEIIHPSMRIFILVF